MLIREDSGTLAALNASLTFNISGADAIQVAVTGTWSQMLAPEVSLDGTNWVSARMYDHTVVIDNAAGATAILANGIYRPLALFNYFRIRSASYTSGTASIRVAQYSIGRA